MQTTIDDLKQNNPPAQDVEIEPPTKEVAVPTRNTQLGLTTLHGFELAQRAAKLLASSTLVPKSYQGNLPNCVIALSMAQRMGADPLMVMQNLYIVHGQPGWSAQFLISAFNMCGRFTSLRYDFFGDKDSDAWGCHAKSTEKATGEKLSGADVTIKIAKQEGWYNRGGSKWQTMPQQMLMYRAAAWFIRAYAPEITMGFQTTDELHDVYDAAKSVDGWEVQGKSSKTERLTEKLKQTKNEKLTEIQETISEPAQDEPQSEEQTVHEVYEDHEWPRLSTGNGVDSVWVDSSGKIYNPRKHEWNVRMDCPNVTESGVFRSRRGHKAVDPNEERAVCVPGQEAQPVQQEHEYDWPRVSSCDGVNSVWIDFNGEVYDPKIHGWSAKENRPSVTSGGFFRSRRGLGKNKDNIVDSSVARHDGNEVPAQQQTSVAPASDDNDLE